MSNEQTWALFERMQGEIAREIRVLLGEEQYDQRIFTAEERARRVEALKKCAAESTDDATRHEAWMKMHLELGWKLGPEFNPATKEHPNLLPWDQLPASTRSKAKIFDICARYASEVANIAPVVPVSIAGALAAARALLERNGPSREKSLVLTKLDEAELWLSRVP